MPLVLTREKVLRIKEELARGVLQTEVAARHGVSQSQVSRIASNRAWASVPWPDGASAGAAAEGRKRDGRREREGGERGATPSGDGRSAEAQPELRVYLRIENLAPQFAAYLSTPVRARGYPPMEGDESLIIEVAPALSIHRIVDLALKAAPDMEPGILYPERQFGLLELHSRNREEVDEAGAAILRGIGAEASDQLAPSTLYTDIIDTVADQHAIILNRMRNASMILPGQSLLLYEMEPALFAAVAANQAERAAPETTIVDIQMMGASGRVFMAGEGGGLRRAQTAIDRTLREIEGRRNQ